MRNTKIKWILPVFYLIVVAYVYMSRKKIYYCLRGFFPLEYITFTVCVIAFVGAICIYSLLLCPWGEKRKFKNATERIPLMNAKGEHPVLIAIKADKSRKHGCIYCIKTKGISILEYEKKIPQIEANLNGKIMNIEYGKNTKQVLLHFLPQKFVKPIIIGVNTVDGMRMLESPNALVVGNTGSGKSYAMTVLLGIYARYTDNLEIVICDYKNASFSQFNDSGNFYGYTKVAEGIEKVYQEFSVRLKGNGEERCKKTICLVVDELGAWLSSMEKKMADEWKKKIGNMLFMGRSLNIKVIIGMQRADAEYFHAGARDQFKAILGLGNLSKEQKQMLFPEYKEQMTNINDVGEGYLLIDGQSLEHVKIAEIKDIEGNNQCIRIAMSEYLGEA